MQDYIDLAKRNGVTLLDNGQCQFCGANTKRGIHECLEIFNLGFEGVDFTQSENQLYRFLIVDAHTLQHSEIHGRWSNHFHLTRLHLILKHKINWTYNLSPRLSDYLNQYKVQRPNEYLKPPDILQRGNVTSVDILKKSEDKENVALFIEEWARVVYNAWKVHHSTVDSIALNFLKRIR